MVFIDKGIASGVAYDTGQPPKAGLLQQDMLLQLWDDRNLLPHNMF